MARVTGSGSDSCDGRSEEMDSIDRAEAAQSQIVTAHRSRFCLLESTRNRSRHHAARTGLEPRMPCETATGVESVDPSGARVAELTAAELERRNLERRSWG